MFVTCVIYVHDIYIYSDIYYLAHCSVLQQLTVVIIRDAMLTEEDYQGGYYTCKGTWKTISALKSLEWGN